MKLSTKTLLIILVVLVLSFVLVQYTKRGGKSKSVRSELVAIDTATITSVEVISAKGSLQLKKKDGNWMVNSESKDFFAKEGAVTSMLNALNTIKPGRLAARKEEKWKDFSVDSTGTRVKVLADSKVVTDIVLGRFGVEGQRNFYTFVRLFEDENVYVANGFMKMNIYEEANDYRDNNIIRLDKDSLTSVTFSISDESFSLSKQDESWYVDGSEADSAAVANFFKDLRYLSDKNFYDNEVSLSATHRVVFSFSDQDDITLNGYPTEGGMVIGSSENQNEKFQNAELEQKVFPSKDVFAPTQ